MSRAGNLLAITVAVASTLLAVLFAAGALGPPGFRSPPSPPPIAPGELGMLPASPADTVQPAVSATPAAPTSSLPTAAAAAPVHPAAPAAIEGARIAVKRLGIDLPLAWGDVGRDVPRGDYAGGTPEKVALVFPGSALPGHGGNTYIYAHARAGMFLSLWGARLGDEIVIAWSAGPTLSYAVTQVVGRVAVTDTRWLDPAGPERLTLQTSTGPAPTDPRFVVIATPASGGLHSVRLEFAAARERGGIVPSRTKGA